MKPDTGGARNIHSPYLSVKNAIISSSELPFSISSRIFPLMLVEKPASESLTANPWQVGHRNSLESFLNRSSNWSFSKEKVKAGIQQVINENNNISKKEIYDFCLTVKNEK